MKVAISACEPEMQKTVTERQNYTSTERQNYTADSDKIYDSTKHKDYWITPGPLPVIRLLPLPSDCNPIPMPLHSLNSFRCLCIALIPVKT